MHPFGSFLQALEISVNAGKDVFRFALAESGNEPIRCIFVFFAVIATVLTMTQRNNIRRNCTGALRRTYRYPVIRRKSVPQASRTIANGAASTKISNTLLPIISSEIIRQIMGSGLSATACRFVNGFGILVVMFLLFADSLFVGMMILALSQKHQCSVYSTIFGFSIENFVMVSGAIVVMIINNLSAMFFVICFCILAMFIAINRSPSGCALSSAFFAPTKSITTTLFAHKKRDGSGLTLFALGALLERGFWGRIIHSYRPQFGYSCPWNVASIRRGNLLPSIIPQKGAI